MAHARGVPVKLSIVGGAFSGQEGLVAELKDEIADVDFITYEGEVTDISPLLKRSHALVIGSTKPKGCLLYTSPSPRDGLLSRMPSSA